MRQNGVRSNVRFPYSSGMKKGGKAKKQGYIDRKDESIAMRIKKKRTPKKELKAAVTSPMENGAAVRVKAKSIHNAPVF